ncbi:MAG: hypothetical protein IKU27_04485 [Clostridia bacterium]|nr:hypothetical protein [Clostridia bacterium]
MTNRPYTNASGWGALLVIPLVYLLIWLFNAQRMGRIDRRCYQILTAVVTVFLVVGLIATLILS